MTRAATGSKEGGLKDQMVSDADLIGHYIAEDIINEETGEIFAEAGDEIRFAGRQIDGGRDVLQEPVCVDVAPRFVDMLEVIDVDDEAADIGATDGQVTQLIELGVAEDDARGLSTAVAGVLIAELRSEREVADQFGAR